MCRLKSLMAFKVHHHLPVHYLEFPQQLGLEIAIAFREFCLQDAERLNSETDEFFTWIAGKRKDHSLSTGANILAVQVDLSFQGLFGRIGRLVKQNLMAKVGGQHILNFFQIINVPASAQGYVLIGCEPSTRLVLPWQLVMEQRLWCEDTKIKDCGSDKGNNKSYGAQFSGYIVGIPPYTNGSEPWFRSYCFCQISQCTEDSNEELADKLVGAQVNGGKFRADGEHKAMANQELQLRSLLPHVVFFHGHSSEPVKYFSDKSVIDSLKNFVGAVW